MRMSIFSDRLRSIRLSKGETQQITADQLNISRNLLSNYERGVRQPDFDMLCTLAKHFDVSTDYLLGLSDVQKRQADLSKIQMEFFNSISELRTTESYIKLTDYITLLKISENYKD